MVQADEPVKGSEEIFVYQIWEDGHLLHPFAKKISRLKHEVKQMDPLPGYKLTGGNHLGQEDVSTLSGKLTER